MARIFIYDNREFPDPDPSMSPEDVRAGLSEFFGEISNAEIRTEARGNDTLYVFEKRVGTKGGEIYQGAGTPWGTRVTVENEGDKRELPMRLDLQNHSPSGLGWGHLGSGPSQLALAVLADSTQDEGYAGRRYQKFKRDVISELPGTCLEIPGSQVEHQSNPLLCEWVRDNP